MTPTLFTSCNTLPPEGAGLAWGGPALAAVAPTLPTACGSLPSEGIELAWDGPALRSDAGLADETEPVGSGALARNCFRPVSSRRPASAKP